MTHSKALATQAHPDCPTSAPHPPPIPLLLPYRVPQTMTLSVHTLCPCLLPCPLPSLLPSTPSSHAPACAVLPWHTQEELRKQFGLSWFRNTVSISAFMPVQWKGLSAFLFHQTGASERQKTMHYSSCHHPPPATASTKPNLVGLRKLGAMPERMAECKRMEVT